MPLLHFALILTSLPSYSVSYACESSQGDRRALPFSGYRPTGMAL